MAAACQRDRPQTKRVARDHDRDIYGIVGRLLDTANGEPGLILGFFKICNKINAVRAEALINRPPVPLLSRLTFGVWRLALLKVSIGMEKETPNFGI